MSAARVTVSIYAGPIRATGNTAGIAGQQVWVSDEVYLYFTPNMAAQWIDTLTIIANEGINE